MCQQDIEYWIYLYTHKTVSQPRVEDNFNRLKRFFDHSINVEFMQMNCLLAQMDSTSVKWQNNIQFLFNLIEQSKCACKKPFRLKSFVYFWFWIFKKIIPRNLIRFPCLIYSNFSQGVKSCAIWFFSIFHAQSKALIYFGHCRSEANNQLEKQWNKITMAYCSLVSVNRYKNWIVSEFCIRN